MSETLEWKPPVSIGSTVLGVGCGGLLLAGMAVGTVGAVAAGEWSALLGLPIGLVFALAFIVIGARRDHVILTPQSLTIRSTLLGIPVRSRRTPLTRPTGLAVESLDQPGIFRSRQSHTLFILDATPVAIQLFEDTARMQTRAAQVSAFLGVPFDDTPQTGLIDAALEALRKA